MGQGTPHASLTQVDQVLNTCLAFWLYRGQVIAPHMSKQYVCTAWRIWFGWANPKVSLTSVDLPIKVALFCLISSFMVQSKMCGCFNPGKVHIIELQVDWFWFLQMP